MGGELEKATLRVQALTNDADVSGILDSCDGARREEKLIPSPLDVYDEVS